MACQCNGRLSFTDICVQIGMSSDVILNFSMYYTLYKEWSVEGYNLLLAIEKPTGGEWSGTGLYKDSCFLACMD